MISTSSIDVQSLGNSVQCADGHLVWKCGVCLFFVCNAPRPERCSLEGRSSNRRCVAVYWPISTSFSAFCFSSFFFSRYTIWFSFPSRAAATIFAKLQSKITKSKKSAEKFVRTTSYTYTWEIWRKFHCVVYDGECRCSSIWTIFHTLLYSADSHCQISYT